ncbi:MAG: beta-propeller fold lactonase family protein [Nitrospirae bacterium]|nr:beta-propeller fold lactonase family protein [Nitrospirota bacterium]
MSRATVLTTSQLRQRRFYQGLFMLALAPMLFFTACSSSDDNGDGNTNNAPSGATNQFAYVIGAGGEIQAYRVDGNGNLTTVGTPIATGASPHHVDVDPSGRFVYVSNHDSPFLSGWRINQDASLTPMNPAPGSPVTGIDPTENESHSSALDKTGQYLYVVAGTGASTLRAYKIDSTPGITLGLLTFIAGQSFPVGTHAHNITVSPNNQFVYVAVEGSGEVHAFSRDTSTGALTPVGIVTGLPGAAAVGVDPAGKFLYACYINAVEVFEIANNGSLTRIQPTSTFPTNENGGGSGPHSLAIHPNGQSLYTANINSSTVSVFQVDPTTGALTEIQSPPVPTGTEPNYVLIHPDGGFLYTADAVSDQVSRFTINANATITPASTLPAGDGADGIGMTKF